MPFKPLKLPLESREETEKAEVAPPSPILEKEKPPAKLSPPDPSGGWKRFILEGDPISVTDIEKYFTEDKIISGKATSQYDTQIKPASATQAFEISLLELWNNSDSDTRCGFRFGTGAIRFEKKLASKTGWIANLTKAKWRGNINTPFNVYSYDPNPNLTYTVFGEYV